MAPWLIETVPGRHGAGTKTGRSIDQDRGLDAISTGLPTPEYMHHPLPVFFSLFLSYLLSFPYRCPLSPRWMPPSRHSNRTLPAHEGRMDARRQG